MEMRVELGQINSINDIYRLRAENKITQKEFNDIEKFYLIQKNNADTLQMTRNEYQALLKKRPLLRYRPLKNSFVKQGDKKLLAAGLKIESVKVDKYIENIIKNNFDIQAANKNSDYDFTPLTEEKMTMTKDYVYRHGTKEQALAWMKNELSDASVTLQRLYKTLRKDSGGIFDYFERPCHLLDNKTAHKMHTTIKYSLDDAQKAGYITEDVNKTACEWALKQIYDIQSDQKLREALKIVKYSGE